MAAALIRCYQGTPGTTETTAYTVPTGKTLLILAIRCANTDSATQTASVSVVPAAGTAGAGNRIIPASTIPANDLLADSDPHVLGAGDFLSVKASNSAVAITISGALL